MKTRIMRTYDLPESLYDYLVEDGQPRRPAMREMLEVVADQAIDAWLIKKMEEIEAAKENEELRHAIKAYDELCDSLQMQGIDVKDKSLSQVGVDLAARLAL